MTDVRHIDEGEAQSFLEGLLPGKERARVDAHLEGCASCQSIILSFERERAKVGERRVVVAVLATVSVALAFAIALAGQAAWAPALSAVSSVGVSALHALRISSDVLSPLVAALRLEILFASAAIGIPLLLALSRLAVPRQGQVA